MLSSAWISPYYLDLIAVEQTFKGLGYSFKLKMKLAIPGKLVEIAHSNTGRTTDLGENSNIYSDEHNNVQIEPATSSAVAV